MSKGMPKTCNLCQQNYEQDEMVKIGLKYNKGTSNEYIVDVWIHPKCKKFPEFERIKPIRCYCQYECSKYCEISDFDMEKVNDKYCCKACYNCAVKTKELSE